MTSLNVAVGPIGNSSSKSSPGIKDGSIPNNSPSVSSVAISQGSGSGHTSVIGSCSCCSNTPIQHSGIGSCLVDGEIPGETTTE
jgi:hypothetical protein